MVGGLSEKFLNCMAGFFCQIVFIRGKGHSTSYKYSNLIYCGNYRGMKNIWNNLETPQATPHDTLQAFRHLKSILYLKRDIILDETVISWSFLGVPWILC